MLSTFTFNIKKFSSKDEIKCTLVHVIAKTKIDVPS